MLLHQNHEAFKEIITATAKQYRYSEDQVEKDYYISLFFKELLKISDLPIIFKGGTSLSKAYNLTNRFSEDLDLAVMFDGRRLGDGKRKKLKYQIIDVAIKLSMDVKNLSDIESDKDYNFYELSYSNQFNPNESILPFLLIETILAYRPYPCEVKEVSNYITKYLQENGRVDLIDQYELQPFNATVQTIERTIIDKLFALCDYHLQKKYTRYSRHLYDIHKIWNSLKLNKEIIPSLVVPIIKDRQLFGIHNLSCMPGAKPVDILNEIINKRVYEDDYKTITSEFIVDEVNYDNCILSLKEIIEKEYLPSKIEKY